MRRRSTITEERAKKLVQKRRYNKNTKQVRNQQNQQNQQNKQNKHTHITAKAVSVNLKEERLTS
ncbi:hypothetical protein PC116_g30347 [Phytophthora cactorum]|nr:hypothetical protein PC116_g30347 [Phytophthora cactorum]